MDIITLQLGKKQILIHIVTDFAALLAFQIFSFGKYNRLRVLSRVPTDDLEPILPPLMTPAAPLGKEPVNTQNSQVQPLWD